MSLPFLLEIGTEEIPDWMIEPALDSLQALFAEAVGSQSISVDGTPRRLVLRATNLPERQADEIKKIAGPAANAPEKAIAGFARKQGVAPTDLQQEDGHYIFSKLIPGRTMRDILADALPGIVLKTSFPKTMYWSGKNGPRFIRPIRWIVALLGDAVVPFEIAGVRSGNVSSGHRQLGASQVPVTIAEYESKLRENGVILSAAARRKKIEDEIGTVRVKRDPALLKTLVYLTEYPTTIQGGFDPEFLKLPEEVLITVMRHHQKYFSVEAPDGTLAPRFVAVMNTSADTNDLVRLGNERVLRARFNDARFFWETDQKKSLEERYLDLEHVTFHATIGSYRAKTGRIETLAAALGGGPAAERAAHLCKCDLTTEVVKEFTELQGVVGGLYAREQGEPEEVWQAVYDHYKPVSMEDSIPRNRAGQLVSIADKLDTLRECFRVNLIPTGSKDPYALRRAAQGVVKILVEGGLRLPIRKSLDVDPKLEDFFLDRVRYYFKDIRGFKYDEVNAVLASGWDDLVDVEERLTAIQSVRPTEHFEPLAASFKRIQNILKQAQFTGEGAVIDSSLLEPGPEADLYRELGNVAQAFLPVRRFKQEERTGANACATQVYRPALESIASLRPKVDLFFDKVLVNAPDTKVRQNRLTLLHTLLAEFSTIADFSEIVTNT